MRILADENIPLAKEAFQSLGKVRLIPGRSIKPEDVREADVLLVRSVTRVDDHLLNGSDLKFVGSATIGTDHVDEEYLRTRGIRFAHAPGCNADSVVEYVMAALYLLANRQEISIKGKTVGIVGCGNIGSRLASRLPALGCKIVKNDPPLAQNADRSGILHDYVSLDQVLEEADIITLHVPLTRSGPFATYRMFDERRLRQIKKGAWLINSCRGAVVSNPALYDILTAGHLGAAVLDVWENEPTPDLGLLQKVDIATPHIAGYSYDGKVMGTIMLYQALTRHFQLPAQWHYENALLPSPEDHPVLHAPDSGFLSGKNSSERSEMAWMNALVKQMYDIDADDRRLRVMTELPSEACGQYFSDLRKSYPRRRSFSRHSLSRPLIPDPYLSAVKDGLQVEITD